MSTIIAAQHLRAAAKEYVVLVVPVLALVTVTGMRNVVQIINAWIASKYVRNLFPFILLSLERVPWLL